LGKSSKVVLFATRAWVVLGFNSFNAHFTEALATASYLISLSNDMQAHWTFSLKIVGRIFYKFTLKSNLMLQYCHSCNNTATSMDILMLEPM
jgi:hypothetical protein